MSPSASEVKYAESLEAVVVVIIIRFHDVEVQRCVTVRFGTVVVRVKVAGRHAPRPFLPFAKPNLSLKLPSSRSRHTLEATVSYTSSSSLLNGSILMPKS